MLSTLWYENEDGERWDDFGEDLDQQPPDNFVYMHARFPREITHRIHRTVLRSEVDACPHTDTRPTTGWVDGIKGRECMDCRGSQLAEDDAPWPEKWDAEGSRAVFSSTSSYSPSLALSLARPSLLERIKALWRTGRWLVGMPFDQAALHAAVSCERCLNVMAYERGLPWGYKATSKHAAGTNTSCELCRFEVEILNDNEVQLSR